MRLHRFYVSQPLGEEVVIDQVSLVSQWSKVFRYVAGDFVILFDGKGLDVTYEIGAISKSQATLLRKAASPSILPTKKITLYLSILKKDNFELVVQKGTELGVTTFVPILTERSEKKNLSFERLEKIAIEAAEQCGRGDIPHISPIVTFAEAVHTLKSDVDVLFFNMNGKALPDQIEGEVAVFIGPEGGWVAKEIDIMREKGYGEYSLAPTVLRAETAALAACAYLGISR